MKSYDDLDIKRLRAKDLYGYPINYGDPFCFIHIIPHMDHAYIGTVVSVHRLILSNNFHKIKSDMFRPWYYEQFNRMPFFNMHTIAHQNIPRLAREYIYFDNFAMHLFLTPKKTRYDERES